MYFIQVTLSCKGMKYIKERNFNLFAEVFWWYILHISSTSSMQIVIIYYSSLFIIYLFWEAVSQTSRVVCPKFGHHIKSSDFYISIYFIFCTGKIILKNLKGLFVLKPFQLSHSDIIFFMAWFKATTYLICINE